MRCKHLRHIIAYAGSCGKIEHDQMATDEADAWSGLVEHAKRIVAAKYPLGAAIKRPHLNSHGGESNNAAGLPDGGHATMPVRSSRTFNLTPPGYSTLLQSIINEGTAPQRNNAATIHMHYPMPRQFDISCITSMRRPSCCHSGWMQ